MKFFIIIVGGILLTNSVVAAQILQAEPVNTNTNTNTSGTLELRAVQPDPIGDTVGGDGEDIGAPAPEDGDPDQPIITGDVPNPAGIEHEDIGVTFDDDVQRPKNKFDGLVNPTIVEFESLGLTPDNETADRNEADIGITLLESVEAFDPEDFSLVRGIDDDEFGFVSNGTPYVRAGYLKISDIKGESSDAGAASGKAETTWKIEEGEKARKPKEIVVVGSKATDRSSPKLQLANCDGTQFVCNAEDVHTDDDLEEYLQRSVNEYDELETVQVNETDLVFVTRQSVRLFGFIPLRMKQTVSIGTAYDSLGRVKVKFPWWHVFSRKTVRPHDFQAMLSDGILDIQIPTWQAVEYDDAGRLITTTDPSSDDESGTIRFGDGEHGAAGPAGEEIQADEHGKTTSENVTLNFAQVKAMLHDTAMAIIRKIG